MGDIKDKAERYDKWYKAQIKKYGSEDKFRQSMRERGLKAKRNTPRGFAVLRETDPKRFKEISKKGYDAGIGANLKKRKEQNER